MYSSYLFYCCEWTPFTGGRCLNPRWFNIWWVACGCCHVHSFVGRKPTSSQSEMCWASDRWTTNDRALRHMVKWSIAATCVKKSRSNSLSTLVERQWLQRHGGKLWYGGIAQRRFTPGAGESVCLHQLAQSKPNTRARGHLSGPRSQAANVTIYVERREETFHKILFYNLQENRIRFSHMMVQPCQWSQHLSKTTCPLQDVFETVAEK